METQESVTVGAILDRYERDCLPKLAPRTQRDYARHLVKLRAIFGSRVADELRPRDFGPFLQVDRGQVSRVRQLAVLSAAFTEAVSAWYWIERNVLRDVKRPKSKPRDRLITDAEFEAVRKTAPERMGLAMQLALLTGQRQGDLLRFKWTDIRDGAIHVRQSKTGKRIAIELNPELKRVLGKCAQLTNREPSEYVLPTRLGKPYTPEGFRAGWQRIIRAWVKRGGENFHFHDIRALAATKCATPEIAMRLLGHTTLAMTMRVYRRGVERVKALSIE